MKCLRLLFAMLALAAPAFTQSVDSKALVITTAAIDFTRYQVTISGENFIGNNGRLPSVLLGNTPLPASGITNTAIVAQLPTGLPSGSYLLTVSNGNGSKDYDSVTITLGAIGSTGAAGATGAPGVAGDTGPAGAPGPQGARGIQGDQGPQGAMGPLGVTGASGPAGSAGPVGPAGIAGTIGPAGPQGPMGAPGLQGSAGPAGISGAAGPAGGAGPAGLQWKGSFDAAQTYQVGDAVSLSGNSLIYADGAWVVLAEPGPAGSAGSIPAASVTTSKLADGSVTAAKLAAGVTGAARQSALDAAVSDRTAADTSLQSTLNAAVSKTGETMSGPLLVPANGLLVGGNQLLMDSGRIGIGKMPAATLDVGGNVAATGFIGDGAALLVDGVTLASLVDRVATLETAAQCRLDPCQVWLKNFPNSRSVAASAGNVAVGGTSVVKVSADGTQIWARDLAGDVALTVAFTSNGDVVAAGSSAADAFVMRLAASTGGTLWSVRLPSAIARALAIDAAGNIMVAGNTADVFITKLSGADGAVIWSRSAGAAGDVVSGVAVDMGGNAAITGTGSANPFVARYSGADGSLVWTRIGGGAGIAVDNNGDVVVGQNTGSPAVAKYSGLNGTPIWSRPFASSAVGAIAVDAKGAALAAGPDTVLAKYAGNDGAQIWTKTLAQSSANLTGISIDATGNVYLLAGGQDGVLVRLRQ